MKHLGFIVATMLLVMACATNKNKELTKIAPMDSGLRLDSFSDCTIAATFSSKDFNWKENLLTLKVFSEDLYDAVEVNQMRTGDTLVYQGNPLVITSITKDKNGFTINKGIEEGGAYLTPNGGGTYRATELDDHSIYTSLGQVRLKLAKDLTIIDCGENPTDPSDTIRTGQEAYINHLATQSKDDFFELNTQVQIENGVVTEIQRKWIP